MSWIFPLPNHSSRIFFVTSLMMLRIEETVGAYVTGRIASLRSRWTGPGNSKNKCKTVKIPRFK